LISGADYNSREIHVKGGNYHCRDGIGRSRDFSARHSVANPYLFQIFFDGAGLPSVNCFYRDSFCRYSYRFRSARPFLILSIITRVSRFFGRSFFCFLNFPRGQMCRNFRVIGFPIYILSTFRTLSDSLMISPNSR